MYQTFLANDSRNTFAISRSFLSVRRIPSYVLKYMEGNTTRKEITKDSCREPAHKRSSITTDATGTVFISMIGGFSKL